MTEGRRGTPQSEAHAILARPDTGDGGDTPRLVQPPPPTARRIGEEEGARGEVQKGAVVGGGAPPPLGGRGELEEQAQAIVDRIVNSQRGGRNTS